MKILAVDTTTPAGSLAVLEDERLLAEIGIESPGTHSSRLVSSVDLLLRALGLSIKDLDGFAVTPGPGSFTGIRIGLSTVKAFAFASGKPVAPVNSLYALAWKIRRERDGLVCPMLDARKGEIYAGLYEAKGGKLKERIAQGAFPPAAFLGRLPARRMVLLIGGGADLYRGLIAKALGERALFSERSPFIAAEVGRLGLGVLRKGRGVQSDELLPVYHRKSQAEEGRERKA